MLRIHQSSSAEGAKSYYAASDYYLAGSEQEMVGEWQGRGAAMLDLKGKIAKADFDKLCDNFSPVDGGPLTLATKDNRRVGYDFNFNAPKSLSVLYGLTKDENLLDAFRSAVYETMADVESEMKTRVRKGGEQSDRVVGNMICAEFVHFTARPVDGVPDPALHAHMFVFNAVHDPVEGEWKAGQFAGVKRDANYFEALFHSRLAGKLRDQGYGIVREGRHWQIAGVDRKVIDTFSRRTALIEAKAKNKGITYADDKAGLGAKTREGKQKDMTWAQLQAWWREQLSAEQQECLAAIYARTEKTATNRASGREALHHAAEHHFERSSVVRERAILETALRYGVGSTDLAAIRKQYEHEGLLTREVDEDRLATSRSVLAEEQAMLTFAREGRARAKPLNPNHQLVRDWLNNDQKAAVRHILHSTDRVMMISGLAGTGKSTLTSEALDGLQAAAIKCQVVAPTTQARDVLRKDGIEAAETLQRLLLDPKLQDCIRDGVLWIDEAGLVSSRDMAKAFALAKEQNAAWYSPATPDSTRAWLVGRHCVYSKLKPVSSP